MLKILIFIVSLVYTTVYVSIDIIESYLPFSRESIYLGLYSLTMLVCFILWWHKPADILPLVLTNASSCLRLLMLMFIWCGLSILWLDPSYYSDATVIWINEMLKCGLLFALCCLGSRRSVFTGGLMGLVTGSLLVLGALLNNSLNGLLRLGVQDVINPNTLGMFMGLSLLIILYFYFKQTQVVWRVFLAVLIIALLSGLILAFSKTAIVAFLSSSFLLFLLKGIKKKEIALFLLVLALTGAVFHERILNNLLSLGDFETLTLRTDIWSYTWNMIARQPIWGHGFKSFQFINPFIFDTAHNDYLNKWFEGGLIGLVLMGGIYLSFFKMGVAALRKKETRLESALALSVMLFFMIRSLAEASNIMMFYPPLLTLFACHLHARREPEVPLFQSFPSPKSAVPTAVEC